MRLTSRKGTIRLKLLLMTNVLSIGTKMTLDDFEPDGGQLPFFSNT